MILPILPGFYHKPEIQASGFIAANPLDRDASMLRTSFVDTTPCYRNLGVSGFGGLWVAVCFGREVRKQGPKVLRMWISGLRFKVKGGK